MENVPTRSNNPGDIRAPGGGFQQYSDPKEGYAALLNDLSAKQSGNTSTGLGPNSSLADFANKYAPPSDGNDSAKYAADLANQLGVSPDTPISQLDVGKWAEAVSKNEGFQGQYQTYNPQPFSDPSKGTSNPASAGVIDFSGLPTVVKTEQNQPFKTGGVAGAVQDVSHGFGKAGLETALGVGRLGQGIQGLVGKGLDAGVSALGGTSHFADQANQGIFSPNSDSGQRVRQNLGATNAGEKIGKGLEFAAELAAPLPKIAGVVKGVKAAEEGLVKAPRIISKIAETITPKQTAKEAAAALERFGGKAGGLFRGARINPDPSIYKMAEKVAEHVPNFKPSGSLVENLNHVKNAVSKLGDNLQTKVIESGKDRIYPVKELGSAITKAIEKQDVSIGLKGTQYEKQAEALKDAALQIAREKGGKVSDLLPARKEFDALVEKIYPNLYDREYTPIRNAVTSVRTAMTDFTEKHLPTDVGLKKSLKDQSALIRVGENLAAKAVSGVEKEIGKSGVQKVVGLVKDHPILSGLSAAGIGGEIKHFLGL